MKVKVEIVLDKIGTIKCMHVTLLILKSLVVVCVMKITEYTTTV